MPSAIALPAASAGEELTISRESHAFWTLRQRQVRAALRRMLATARLRVSLVITLSLVSSGPRCFTCSIQRASGYSGWHMFPHELPAAVHRLLRLALWRCWSSPSGVIMYSSLYCSAEAPFLLTTPARPERIFAYQFQEAIWFSGWGFVLLGSPMLVASGAVMQAPWYYYAMLLPMMVAFLYIPASLGAMACLLLVDRLGRIRWRAVRVGLILLIGAIGLLGWSLFRDTKSDLMTPGWFQEFTHRLQYTEIRLLPSISVVESRGIDRSHSRAAAVQFARRPSLKDAEHFIPGPAHVQRVVLSSGLAVWLARRGFIAPASAGCTPNKRRSPPGPLKLAWIACCWAAGSASPARSAC